MSNMSYCRFENTTTDMRDCIEELENEGYELELMQSDMSSHEAIALKQFIKMCRDVSESTSHIDLESIEFTGRQ